MQKYILPLVLLSLIATGCSRNDKSSDTDPTAIDSAAYPDSEVSGAKIYLYNRGGITTEILANKIVQFESKDSTMAYMLDIDAFDTLGNVTSEIVGDSGIIRENEGRFTIFGNVVVITQDGMRLETDYLYWDSQHDRIFTDAFVQITTDGEVLRGWGMEGDQQLKRYKILHRVSGEIDDPNQLKTP